MFRQLFSSALSGRRKPRPAHRVERRARLEVQSLEGRLLLASGLVSSKADLCLTLTAPIKPAIVKPALPAKAEPAKATAFTCIEVDKATTQPAANAVPTTATKAPAVGSQNLSKYTVTTLRGSQLPPTDLNLMVRVDQLSTSLEKLGKSVLPNGGKPHTPLEPVKPVNPTAKEPAPGPVQHPLVQKGQEQWRQFEAGLKAALEKYGVAGLFGRLTNSRPGPVTGPWTGNPQGGSLTLSTSGPYGDISARLDAWNRISSDSDNPYRGGPDVGLATDLMSNSAIRDLIVQELTSTSQSLLEDAWSRGWNVLDPGTATGNLWFLQGEKIDLNSKPGLGRTQELVDDVFAFVGTLAGALGAPAAAKAAASATGLTVLEAAAAVAAAKLVGLASAGYVGWKVGQVADGIHTAVLSAATGKQDYKLGDLACDASGCDKAKTQSQQAPTGQSSQGPAKPDQGPKQKDSPNGPRFDKGDAASAAELAQAIFRRYVDGLRLPGGGAKETQAVDLDKLISKTVAYALAKVNPVPDGPVGGGTSQGGSSGGGTNPGRGIVGGDPTEGTRGTTPTNWKGPQPTPVNPLGPRGSSPV